MKFEKLTRVLNVSVLVAAVASFAACKKDDDGDDSNYGLDDTVVVGSISGFGSIIVNGIRFDDDGATVSDDSDNDSNSTELGLGMTVEVRGSSSDDGTGVASSISMFSEVQGPIADLDSTAGTFTLLGHAVTVTASTVFDDFGGLAALANDNIVEVYGLRNGTAITASRIERKTPGSGDPVAKLRGRVSDLDSTAMTFKIGGVTVTYSSATVKPAATDLANDIIVKAVSTKTPTGLALDASSVVVKGDKLFGSSNVGRVELQGVVSDFTSIGSFKINGIAINATDALFLRGVAADVANGTILEVKGAFTDDTLVATKVKFEDNSESDSFELHGAVSSFTSLASFVVRGISVDASGANVDFERGVAADVANDRLVEVEGALAATATGSKLVATHVKFEDVSGRGGSDDDSGSGSANGSGSGSGSGSDDSSDEYEYTAQVTSVDGNTLVVGDHTVTLTSSTVYRRMSKADIVVGALLEVKGTLAADGTVTATRVSLED